LPKLSKKIDDRVSMKMNLTLKSEKDVIKPPVGPAQGVYSVKMKDDHYKSFTHMDRININL
jgi:hypothetical protein